MKSYITKTLVALAVFGCFISNSALGMPCPEDAAESCECSHGPLSLPGLGGPPEWFDANGDGFWRPELHDPRWSGAPLIPLDYSDQIGISDAAQARVLSHGDYLYISLQVVFDDEGPDAQDMAFLGITKGSLAQAYAVRILFTGDGSGGTAPADPDPSDDEPVPQDDPLPEPLMGGFVSHWESSATGDFSGATEQFSAPGWLDQIAVWKPSATTISPGDTRKWAVTMRIDKSASGLNPSPGSIHLFLGVGIHLDGGGVPDFIPFATANPDMTDDVPTGVGGTIIPDDTTSWVRYAELGTACNIGISLSPSDIGVFPGVPGTTPAGSLTNRICASDPCPATTPGGNPENVFRAIARNVDASGGLTAWDVRARFRIADWGSTVINRKFGPWKDIAAIPTGTDILMGPDTDLTPANGWYWQQQDDGSGTTYNVIIDYQCDISGPEDYCPKLTNPANDHQCILVELGGKNREFARSAVYRNMNYHGLSNLDRPAKISIEGLKEITGSAVDRDVYLYVQTENMPKHQQKPMWLPTKDMAAAQALSQNPTPIPFPPGKEAEKATAVARKGMTKDAVERLEARRKMVIERVSRIARSRQKIGKIPLSNTLAMRPEQLLDAVWPTYRIRPFYDTGKTHTFKGKKSKVLAPLAPFGFRLSHDKALYGFSHALQAANPHLKLEKLSDHWYKIRIKSEGSVEIRTKIAAEENPLRTVPTPEKVDCEACKASCKECQKTGICNCRLSSSSNRSSLALMTTCLFVVVLLLRRRFRRSG